MAMEKMDSILAEIHSQIPAETYAVLWERYQDLCDCVYKMSSIGHNLERYEFTDSFFKPLGELFPRVSEMCKS